MAIQFGSIFPVLKTDGSEPAGSVLARASTLARTVSPERNHAAAIVPPAALGIDQPAIQKHIPLVVLTEAHQDRFERGKDDAETRQALADDVKARLMEDITALGLSEGGLLA